MDKLLRQKIEEKLQETLSNKNEIKEIVDSLEKMKSVRDYTWDSYWRIIQFILLPNKKNLE